jgi:dinuclear metal center YbgI/SA1388 family protein
MRKKRYSLFMILEEFDKRMNMLLDIDRIAPIDSAINGVQVGDLGAEISKIAFAVDASIETFKRAQAWGANLVFVHHGIFWNKQKPITGNLYRRISYLMEQKLALYAVHLPLDIHPDLGNNIGIARRLKLENPLPFGNYKGIRIGIKGALPESKSIEEIINILCITRDCCLGALPFGKEEITSVGIVSGSDWEAGLDAITEKLDLFIAGAPAHEIYHDSLEAGINVIFGGHYNTEVWGIKQVAEKVKEIPGMEVTILDIPTGL